MKIKSFILIVLYFGMIFVLAYISPHNSKEAEENKVIDEQIVSEKENEVPTNVTEESKDNEEVKEEKEETTSDDEEDEDGELEGDEVEVVKSKYSYKLIKGEWFNDLKYFKIGSKDISKDIDETFVDLEVKEYKDFIVIDSSEGGTCGPTTTTIYIFDYDGNKKYSTVVEIENDKFDTELGNYVLMGYDYDESSKTLKLGYSVSHYTKFESCDSNIISEIVGHYIDDEENYEDHKFTTKECDKLKKYKDINMDKDVELLYEDNKFVKKSTEYSNKFSEEYKSIFGKCSN